MAGILYRCIFCETPHEVSRRTDGPVYLRCPTTYQWAWYDERAFLAAPSRGGSRAASAGSTAGARRRPAAAGRRAGRAGRKTAGRKTAARSAARRSTARRSAVRKSTRKRGRR